MNVPEKCGEIEPSLVLFVADNSDDCVSLISSAINENEYTLLDKNKPLEGFKINKNIEVDIKCNPDAKEPTFNPLPTRIEIQSRDSCGEYNEAARVFATHKYLLCLILIVIGLILLTIGGYKWDALMGFVGFIVGFGLMFFIFWSFVEYKEESTSYIIIVIIATTVGILAAYLCRTFVLLSYLLMGFAAGFFLSKYLLTTFQFVGEKVI